MAGQNRGRRWRMARWTALAVAPALCAAAGPASAQQVQVPPIVVEIVVETPPLLQPVQVPGVTVPPVSPVPPRPVQPLPPLLPPSPSQSAVNLPLPDPLTTVVLPPLPVPLPDLPPVLQRVPSPQPTDRGPSSAAVVGASRPVPETPAAAAAAPRIDAEEPVAAALASLPVAAPAVAVSPPPTPPPSSLTGDAARAMKQFTFPLGMMGVMVVFLLVQALVDRRDPKLAAAPMIDELYMFR